mgnify:CR=1 FL=1
MKISFDPEVQVHVYRRRADIHSMLLRAIDNSLHERFTAKVHYPNRFDLDDAKRCLEAFEECFSRVTDRFIASVGNSEAMALRVLNDILVTPTQVVKNDDHVSSEIVPLKPSVRPTVSRPSSSRLKSARPARRLTPSDWYRESYPKGSTYRINGDLGIGPDVWFTEKMTLYEFQTILVRASHDKRINVTPDDANTYFRRLITR